MAGVEAGEGGLTGEAGNVLVEHLQIDLGIVRHPDVEGGKIGLLLSRGKSALGRNVEAADEAAVGVQSGCVAAVADLEDFIVDVEFLLASARTGTAAHGIAPNLITDVCCSRPLGISEEPVLAGTQWAQVVIPSLVQVFRID